MTRIAGASIVLSVPVLVVLVLTLGGPLEYELECNRPRGLCVLRQQFLTRSRTEQVPINSIRSADVQGGAGRRGPSPVTLGLISHRDDRWIVATYGSRAEADEAARTISGFLSDPNATRLVLSKSSSAAHWIAWSMVPVVAVWLVVLFGGSLSKRNTPP